MLPNKDVIRIIDAERELLKITKYFGDFIWGPNDYLAINAGESRRREVCWTKTQIYKWKTSSDQQQAGTG